jgi:nucleoside-diphosphate-sugar epimerase
VKILITGDAGFVGGYFRKALDGHEIVGVDIKNGPSMWQDARYFFANDNTYFDLVVHLAAIVGGRATIEGAPLSVAVDLAIDSELFQWALRTKPGRIIYYSSSAAYPIEYQKLKDKIRLSEQHIDLSNIKSPDYTYGWAKLTGEMLASYAEKEGLRVHIFRPFSGYGEDQSLDYPFPSFIKRGVEKADPFIIWGTGNQTRDFMHMEDVVEATLEAVKQDVLGPVNLGVGRATSFNQLAEIVAKQCGYSPSFERKIEAPEGVEYRVCNPSKMLSFYKPKISLEEGISRAIKYMQGL